MPIALIQLVRRRSPWLFFLFFLTTICVWRAASIPPTAIAGGAGPTGADPTGGSSNLCDSGDRVSTPVDNVLQTCAKCSPTTPSDDARPTPPTTPSDPAPAGLTEPQDAVYPGDDVAPDAASEAAGSAQGCLQPERGEFVCFLPLSIADTDGPIKPIKERAYI